MEVVTRLLSCFLLLPAFPFALHYGDDASTWTPVKIPGEQAAPEFADITAWINSKPLTMKGLTGKVVVVHFMAFG
jgi:hypothetical protein